MKCSVQKEHKYKNELLSTRVYLAKEKNNKSNKTNKEKIGQDKKRHDEIIRQDEIRQDKT